MFHWESELTELNVDMYIKNNLSILNNVSILIYKDNILKRSSLKKLHALVFFTFKNLLSHLNWFIQTAKQDYQNKFGEKLSDPMISAKCFRPMVKKSSKLQKNIKYFKYVLCFTQTFSILNNTIMNIIPKFILHPLTNSGFHHI